MGRLAGFTSRQVMKRLRRLGFQFERTAKGSHELWRNPRTDRITVIPNHPGSLKEGTLRTILRQADVRVQTCTL